MDKMSKTVSFSSFSSFSSISNLLSLPSFNSLPNSFNSLPSKLNQTFSQSMMEEALEAAESIIKKWDRKSPSYTKIISMFSHNRKEAKEFIRCVRDLRKAMHYLISQDSKSDKLVLAQHLMQMGMSTLEKEFFQILSSNREYLDPESTSVQSTISSSNSEFEVYMEYDDDVEDDVLRKAGESISQVEKASSLVMSDLKVIAETMIICGYGKECIKSYKLIRKSIVDEGLHLLGLEKVNTSQFQKMDWGVLEHKIKNWIKAAKIGVTTLLRGEKLLCDHVFSASITIGQSCFNQIAKEARLNLFMLPELVANKEKEKKPRPERIFMLMDLYAAISDLWPDIEMIFNFDSLASVQTIVLSTLKKLKESIHTGLKDFETTIHKDSSKEVPPEGGVHKLTRTTMIFISSLSEHSRVLSEILNEIPIKRNTHMLEYYFTAPVLEDEHVNNQACSVHLAWLILVFLCKLDTKAESYKDVSLSYIFIMNNLQFVVDTVRSTNLKSLLGDDWLTKHEAKLRSYAAKYETAAWTNVFASLPAQNSTKLSAEEAITCFKRFHASFAGAYMKQSSCVIEDAKFRDELKVSIARKLVPVYREFYDKYLPTLRQKSNIEMLVNFKPDNLENYLSDLFHGTEMITGSSHSASSSLSSSSCCSIGCLKN